MVLDTLGDTIGNTKIKTLPDRKAKRTENL